MYQYIMNYTSLGSITSIKLDGKQWNTDINRFDDIIFNCCNGTLHLSYTYMCCEESYFLNIDDKSLVGKTIESIVRSSSDYDNLVVEDTEDVNKFTNDIIEDKFYTITFTDTTTHILILRCRSNGYYRTSLIQNIKLNN